MATGVEKSKNKIGATLLVHPWLLLLLKREHFFDCRSKNYFNEWPLHARFDVKEDLIFHRDLHLNAIFGPLRGQTITFSNLRRSARFLVNKERRGNLFRMRKNKVKRLNSISLLTRPCFSYSELTLEEQKDHRKTPCNSVHSAAPSHMCFHKKCARSSDFVQTSRIDLARLSSQSRRELK